MKSYKIVSGVELEMEYNTDLIGIINTDSYKGHNFTHLDDAKTFACEDDTSLSPNTFIAGECAEIITKVFELKKIDKILKAFQTEIFNRIARHKGISYADASKYELKDVLSFNSHTGTHIHYSLLKMTPKNTKSQYFTNRNMPFRIEHAQPFNFKKIASPKFYLSLNEKVLNEVKSQLPKVYAKFGDAFYRRSYAKIFEEDDQISHLVHDRYFTHNLSLVDFNHVEFRSFNLRGVTTWNEFFKMFDIVKNVFYEHFENSINEKFKTEIKETFCITEYEDTENETEIYEIRENQQHENVLTLNNEEDEYTMRL